MLADATSSKAAASVIALVTCVVLCGGFTSYFINSDGTELAHIQTLHQGNMTYQLTRVRTMDSGLLSDTFWIFRCKTDDTNCHYVEYDGRKTYPVINENTLGNLVIDRETNALYLQIGDQKTLIAQ